jgi:DNA-binding transcriptional MerR regulator
MQLTSKQAADLVGATVRTLRHYHQIGLVPEPDRTWGGYRVYSANDVLRLLRVQRLTRIGLSLADVATILESPDAPEAHKIMRDLDHQLAESINTMRAQRRAIAAMRKAGAPIDVLPEFARHIAVLRELGESEADLAMEKMFIDVIAGLGSPDDVAQVQAVFEVLENQTPTLRQVIALDASLRDIGPDSSKAEIDDFAEQYAQALVALLDEYFESHSSVQWSVEAPLETLMHSLIRDQLNEEQLAVVTYAIDVANGYAEQLAHT